MLKGGREMYFRKKEFIQVADGLQKQIFALKKELNSLNAGQLVCRERKGKIYYSEITEQGERGITKDRDKIGQLIRAEYIKKELELLRENKKVMSCCIEKYVDDFDKKIIEDIIVRHPHLPIDQIVQAHCRKEREDESNDNYEKNPYYPENLKFKTINGVALRSKSEREIGNALESLGLEYDSDILIKCGENRWYADFIIKRPNGTKVLWEHFGREHDTIYMAKNAVRIRDYISLGLRPWEDLIWTLDSDIEDSRNIRRIIRRFILSELDS